jgi:hypothetical protein
MCQYSVFALESGLVLTTFNWFMQLFYTHTFVFLLQSSLPKVYNDYSCIASSRFFSSSCQMDTIFRLALFCTKYMFIVFKTSMSNATCGRARVQRATLLASNIRLRTRAPCIGTGNARLDWCGHFQKRVKSRRGWLSILDGCFTMRRVYH